MGHTPAISMRLLKTEIASSVKASSVKNLHRPIHCLYPRLSAENGYAFLELLCHSKTFLFIKPKDSHPCTYSVGLYSLCGFSHSTSVPANNGVAPPPQKPTSTPAPLSSRIAACVTEVPLPKRITVVLAIGIFQNKFSFSSPSNKQYVHPSA